MASEARVGEEEPKQLPVINEHKSLLNSEALYQVLAACRFLSRPLSLSLSLTIARLW